MYYTPSNYIYIYTNFIQILLEKVEIPTEFREEIYFFFNRDEIRDRKNN
jgi:hypothetical protein